MLRLHRLIAVVGSILLTGGCRDSLAPVPAPGLDRASGNIGRSVQSIAASANGQALFYSTYLGGSSWDFGFSIVVDAAGNAYVTGYTGSLNFPTTAGALQPVKRGNDDVFVTKLNPAGSAPLVYSTYLGGNSTDVGYGIALDLAGNAHVTGFTCSGDFPTTAGAFDATSNGGCDAFVTKLNPAGSAPLMYSTYLGGNSYEEGRGIALDPAGNAHVTGYTCSFNFPTTAGAFQQTNQGCNDAFVTKLNPAGSAPLVYSTYLGGNSTDGGYGIALDPVGNAHVTGFACSNNFPTTAGAFDATFSFSCEAFVTKLNPTGSAPLVYSTYLGGNSTDVGYGIALDLAGNAHVTGYTCSNNFPTTAAAFQQTNAGSGCYDVFVTKLNPAGSAPLVYSTYLGGNSSDLGQGIALDPAGNAYVTGYTCSFNFPTTAGAFQQTQQGCNDAFVTKLNPAGSAPLVYSTYLGGNSTDQGQGIALDPAGNAYVTGYTYSNTFPTTPGAFDATFNGNADAFVTKIGMIPVGPPATLELEPKTATNTVDAEHCVTATVRDASGKPVPDIVVRFEVSGAVNTNGSATTDENGQATFCYQGPPLPGADLITAFADTDEDQTQDADEPGDAATKTWILPPTTPLCEISISNGGRITAMNGDKATFGGNAKSSETRATQGQEEYQDHGPAQRMNMHSINVLAIVCDGPGQEASIYGEATIDGMDKYPYRIKVRDLGEPGVGRDKYWILLGNGYTSGDQTLEGGNVQIRR